MQELLVDELFSYSRLWVQGWAGGCRQWEEWKRKEIFDQSRETLGQSRFEGHWTFLGLQMTSGRMGQSLGGAGEWRVWTGKASLHSPRKGGS